MRMRELARMPGFTAAASTPRNLRSASATAQSPNCTFICDEAYTIYTDCESDYIYPSYEACIDSDECQDYGDCCCTPVIKCVQGHTRCCTTTNGPCTGAGGPDKCITVGGLTQCCHSNWLYGWWPWVTICDDGTRNSGCSGPCY